MKMRSFHQTISSCRTRGARLLAALALAGALVIPFASNPAAAQQAIVSDKSEFCLATDGTLTSCTPDANQFTRTYYPRNAFVFTTASGCLDGRGGQGNRVAVAPCDGSLAQDWYVKDGVRIQNKANNLCLDVQDEKFYAGAPVVLWGCHNGSNQNFALGLVTGETRGMKVVTPSSIASFVKDGQIALKGRNNVIGAGGGNVIGNATANVIGNASGTLIGQAGSNAKPKDGSNVIGNATGNVIGAGGGNLIGQAGSNYSVLSDDGGASEPTTLAGSARSAVAGTHQSCALGNAGQAYCWGSAGFGIFGDGKMGGSGTPAPVATTAAFTAIDAGGNYTCALTVSGEAYCWGYNGYGELGDGTTTGTHEIKAVTGGITFAFLSTGMHHACALNANGKAYCWGRNSTGELGDGSTTNRSTPTPVAGDITFRTISAGSQHTCGVTTNGAAYCWGLNGGRLGTGDRVNRSVPTPVAKDLPFRTISAGGSHTCAVTTSSAAYCWGYNNGGGQLGDGSTTSTTAWPTPNAVAGNLTFASVSAGNTHVRCDHQWRSLLLGV